MFNLYLSDLPSIFDESCDPVDLFGSKLGCLMFADDLVILSESSKGLQRAIDRLQNYCSKWGLTINIDKTKVLIFNPRGLSLSEHPDHQFFIENDKLGS